MTRVCQQGHYIEVAQGGIFMEQKMRFGPVGNTEKKSLGQLHMSNFCRHFFHVLMGKKTL